MLDLISFTDRIYDIAGRYDSRYPQLPSDEDVEAYCEVKKMFFGDEDCRRYMNLLQDESTESIKDLSYIGDAFSDLSGLRNLLRDQISGVARYVVKLFIGRTMDFYKEKAQRRDLYVLMTKIVHIYRKCDFEKVDENVDYIYGVLTTYRYAYGHEFCEDLEDLQEQSVERKSVPELKDLRKRRGTTRPDVR